MRSRPWQLAFLNHALALIKQPWNPCVFHRVSCAQVLVAYKISVHDPKFRSPTSDNMEKCCWSASQEIESQEMRMCAFSGQTCTGEQKVTIHYKKLLQDLPRHQKSIATKCYAVLYVMSTWATKRRKGGNEERQNQWLNGNPKEIHPMKMKNPNTEPDHRINGDECEIWKSLTTKDNSTTNNNEPVSYNLQVQERYIEETTKSKLKTTNIQICTAIQWATSQPPTHGIEHRPQEDWHKITPRWRSSTVPSTPNKTCTLALLFSANSSKSW